MHDNDLVPPEEIAPKTINPTHDCTIRMLSERDQSRLLAPGGPGSLKRGIILANVEHS